MLGSLFKAVKAKTPQLQKAIARPQPVRTVHPPAPTAVRPPMSTYSPAPTAPQQPLRSLAEAIASQVRVPVKQYTLNDVFSNDDQRLARQNIASRVARLIDPQRAQGIENIQSDFASRNLFRSGLRERGLGDFEADIADTRKTQEEELFSIRMAEALESLQKRQQEAEREAALVNGSINFRDYI